MTGATLIICIWLAPVHPADVALTAMGLLEPPPCELNAIPMASYSECRKLLPLVLRRLREQYPAANGGCRP